MTYGFFPFVSLTSTKDQIPVQIERATPAQLDTVHTDPKWQTDWSSEYLADPTIDKFAVTTEDGEMIALGAYQVQDRKTHVIIVYAESAPHSNPTMHLYEDRKYHGIGQLLIAFGIKYSIDNGCLGVVVFEAKTDELARHYERDFHAIRIPSLGEGLKRYMLADELAWKMLSNYLKEVSE